MKLKHKILALNIGTFIALFFVIGTVITLITDNYNLSNTLKYLQGQSRYASTYIEQFALNKSINIFDITSSIDRYGPYLAAVMKDTTKSRVQIFYGAALISDSDESTLTDPQANSQIRPEIGAALEGKSAYFIRPMNGGRVFYFAFPVNISNRFMYTVCFIYPLTEADTMRSDIIKIFCLTAVLLSIIILFSSNLISNHLTNPIVNLRNTARSFSLGNLSIRTSRTSQDEVGDLSLTFNNMADNIQEMIDKLNEEADKQKHFFDNFTHEIRTPLTSIIGYADLLWKADSPELRDKSIFYISSEAQRLVKMTERLLELSKLKKFDFELEKKIVSLAEIIDSACHSLEYKAEQNNIEFRLHLDNVKQFVDPELMRQVVLNILDNSIKYSGSRYIDIYLKRHKNITKITIKDNGAGISDEDKEKIFDPYFKGDKSRNSEAEGWGLGLSIVKEIIEKHGGTIKMFSQEDKGTETIIELPKIEV